jgi:hypothetical protein
MRRLQRSWFWACTKIDCFRSYLHSMLAAKSLVIDAPTARPGTLTLNGLSQMWSA